MKAKKKPLDTLTLGALGVEPRAQLKAVNCRHRRKEKGCAGEGRRGTGRGAEAEGLL